MNNAQLKRYAVPLWQGIVELIYFSPVWLTIGIYSLPHTLLLPWGLILLLSYCIPRVVAYNRSQIRNGYRIATDIVLGVAPLIVIATAGSVQLSILAWIGCSLVGIIVVESSFRALLMRWTYSFTAIMMIILLILAIVLQVLKVIVLHELSAYNTLYYSLGIIAMLLYLFIHNERTIKDQQMIDESSAAIRRSVVMNRWYISILSLIVIGITSAREIQHIIERYIKQLFAAILAWLTQDREVEPQPVEEPPVQMQPIMDLGPEKEPSKFWLLLESIVKWLAIIAITAIAIFLITYALRKLLPAIRKLMAHLLKLKSLQSSKEIGYTDVIEDIKHERHKEKSLRKKSKLTSPMKRWDRLSAAEKVRALYSYAVEHGLRRGKPLAHYLTAKESIAVLKQDEEASTSQWYDRLLHSYEEARYGMLEQTDEEAEQLRKQLENARKR